jgi:hypothetical protein
MGARPVQREAFGAEMGPTLGLWEFDVVKHSKLHTDDSYAFATAVGACRRTAPPVRYTQETYDASYREGWCLCTGERHAVRYGEATQADVIAGYPHPHPHPHTFPFPSARPTQSRHMGR